MIDDIHARKAINGTAARVLAKGEHFTSSKKVLTADSETPLPLRPIPLNMEDLRGEKFGRFTVLGAAAHHKGRWVVRCACGMYTLRTTKAVKNPANTVDCCEQCRHLRYLKNSDFFRRTGKD